MWWVPLAAAAMNMAGGAANKAPAPTSADAIFGGGMFSVDSSNWQVNFGDGATQANTGDRQGPSMVQPQTYDRQPAPVAPAQTYGPSGGAGTGAPAPVPQGAAQQAAATIGGIPVLWIVIGLGALVLWKKR